MIHYCFKQETLTEVIPRLNIVREKLLKSQEEYSKICDPVYVQQLKEKLSDIFARLGNTERRLRVSSGVEVN